MARTARVKENFGTYYVTQTSSGCRPLFKDDADREYFISILQKTVNKFNCKVLQYCAQSDDTYHLIVDVNGGDLSKIMKSINIPYAMHAPCEGKLFKDRYKSVPLESAEDIKVYENKIKSCIDMNGGFNSFCSSEITPCADSKNDHCTDCITDTDGAYAKIEALAGEMDLTVNELFKDKLTRNALMKDIRQNSTLSLKTIGEIFGGLSESTVCKILNQ